ncbi:GNAT family N-acetyltransferase [Streptomyces sp. DSM 42041]|uniref:GNAT family N-acetyltransferase n=1 Tax=Streptomyces hazeniae TaxID=3075538 RepID=A0ABU2NV65_9ACTN|nr:GNAT family N-acetyltransferase [Streptomyces sp. DSM 42041]MDT0380620.1 GNAT family N-acetyltransferase [Streptomyces sp. DSM 42041]
MPTLVPPVLPPGTLAKTAQPALPADGGLTLRPWQTTDAPAVVAAFRDPAIQQWHRRRADSEDEARDWIARWRATWQAETDAHWAVVDTATDALVGRAALRCLALSEGQADAGYWTLPAARGRGVAASAVAAMAAWAFEDVGFHRLELQHSVANPASCRVAAKTGFALEGTRRAALRHPDAWHDMHLHARLAPEA